MEDGSTIAALSSGDIPSAVWWWFGVSLALFLLEMATMSLFLMWPALAAAIVGGIVVFVPEMGAAVQVALFAALSVLLTFVGRSAFNARRADQSSDRPNLNRRGAQLIGRRVTALGAFTNGIGAVQVDDGQWRARLDAGSTASVAAGAALVVADVDGATLVVTPAATSADREAGH